MDSTHREFAHGHNIHHDPRGELNLPRALVTEKAFPENEVVTSTVANANGAPSWTTDIIDKRTIFNAHPARDGRSGELLGPGLQLD